jgi:hypothetical protein
VPTQHDDVMVIIFIQTLTRLDYEWFMSLPRRSISSFYDLETMFLTMYAPPVAYNIVLTQFTQIRLKIGERIRDFNLIFFKTLNQILEEQKANALVIL